ncbi:hypothetical protein AWV80_01335 [Cupriavidus sp. UYMU48A]|nr:hypothetical protein AWV80_01335 [Cupriavidus sp. UYMU48A]
MSTDIVDRLEAFNEYAQSSDSRQVMKDAASEIRALRQQIAEMNKVMLRANSNKVSRRAA